MKYEVCFKIIWGGGIAGGDVDETKLLVELVIVEGGWWVRGPHYPDTTTFVYIWKFP